MPRGIPNKKKDTVENIETLETAEPDEVVESGKFAGTAEEPDIPEPEEVLVQPLIPSPSVQEVRPVVTQGAVICGPVKVYQTPSMNSKALIVTGNVTTTGREISGMIEVNYMKYGFGIVQGYIHNEA